MQFRRDILRSNRILTIAAAILLAAALLLPLAGCQNAASPENPVLVLEKQGIEYAYPHFSAEASQILFQSNESGYWRLAVLDLRDKRVSYLTDDSVNCYFADWSPDNARVCFVSDRTGNEELYVMNSDGSAGSQLTANGARNIHPYWSPDGSRILFTSTMDSPDNLELFEMNGDGSGIHRVTNTSDHETCSRLSPDNTKIVFLRNNDTGLDDIFVMSLPDSTVTNLTNTRARDGWPMWMPDGTGVVYATVEDDAFRLFRFNLADGTRTKLCDPPDGSNDCRPNVSADGSKIVFNRQTDREGERTNAIWILTM